MISSEQIEKQNLTDQVINNLLMLYRGKKNQIPSIHTHTQYFHILLCNFYLPFNKSDQKHANFAVNDHFVTAYSYRFSSSDE